MEFAQEREDGIEIHAGRVVGEERQ
jgi:hypothetical protein